MLKNTSNQNALLNCAKLMGLVSLGLLAGCIADAGPEIPLEEGIGEAESAFSAEICDGIDNDGDFLMDEDPNDSENGGACKPKIIKSVHDNHEYLFVDREFAWDTAHAVCKGRGFDLTKIDNAAENSYLTSFLVSPLRAWTGLSDQTAEGSWLWTDGSTPTYTQWIQGQPNNDLGTEDCAILYHTSGMWAAVSCEARYRSFCELFDPIVWSPFQGVVVNGTQLTKTAGLGWDAGAASSNFITGDGFVQFSMLENNKAKMVGLNALAPGENPGLKSFGQIDFAIVLGDDGSVRISENASYLSPTILLGHYVPGDVFRVEVLNGKVRYMRNGALMYSSTKSIAGPLRVDALFHGVGGTDGSTVSDVRFKECVAGDTQCIEAGLWENAAGVLARDNIVQSYGWTRSVSTIQGVSGNAYIELKTPEVQQPGSAMAFKYAGLRDKLKSRNLGNLQYGIRFALVNGVPKAVAWLNGSEAWACNAARYQDYVAGDKFRIDIQNGMVSYKKNDDDIPFCTVGAQPLLASPHVLDVHFDHEQGRFEELSIVQQ